MLHLSHVDSSGKRPNENADKDRMNTCICTTGTSLDEVLSDETAKSAGTDVPLFLDRSKTEVVRSTCEDPSY